RARGRAPGLDDGRQDHAMALVERIGAGSQYLQIHAVHAYLVQATRRSSRGITIVKQPRGGGQNKNPPDLHPAGARTASGRREAGQHARDDALGEFSDVNGRVRRRLPAAAKMAVPIPDWSSAVPGSPRPPGTPSRLMEWLSRTLGVSFIRATPY